MNTHLVLVEWIFRNLPDSILVVAIDRQWLHFAIEYTFNI